MRSPGSAKKWCICHANLNKGEILFQTQQIYIYIYIYMKADKGAAEIKLCYPMFACKGKL